MFVWIFLANAVGNYIHIIMLPMRCLRSEEEIQTSLNFVDWNQLDLMNKH